MRKILFRAKRLKTNDWIYGYPLRFGFTGKEKWFLLPTYASSFYEMEIDPSTIGEWTGLENEEGWRIFEGDIFVNNDEAYGKLYYQVVWDYSTWLLEPIGDDAPALGMTWAETQKIVGNIHDNPELLKGCES